MTSIWSWSTTASNNGTADSGINFAEGQLAATVNDSARVLMKRVAEFLDDIGAGTASTGSSNAYVLTSASAFTAYADGIIVGFTANFTNSGSATLNANGNGAKVIYAHGSVLAGGEIVSGGAYVLAYDSALNASAGGWHLLNAKTTASLLGAMPTTGGTFTGTVTFDDDATFNTPTYFSDTPNIQGTSPILNWYESDAGVDAKYWRIYSNGAQIKIGTVNDAYTVSADALTIARTGTTVDSFTVTATSIGLTGATAVTGAFTASSTAVITGSLTAAGVTATSTSPALILIETGITADNGRWDFIADAENLQARVVNDAVNSATAYMTVNRTGTTVDSVALAGTAVTINGGTAWHSSNDGTGSTLDADLLDTYHAADLRLGAITSAATTSGTTVSFDVTGYSEVLLLFSGVSTDAADNLILRLSDDGGTYDATGYFSVAGSTDPGAAALTTGIQLTRGTGSGAAATWTGTIRISGIADAALRTSTMGTLGRNAGDYVCFSSGFYDTARADTHIRILGSAGGTFDAGNIYVYGRK